MTLLKSDIQLSLRSTGARFWKPNSQIVCNVQVTVSQAPVILKNTMRNSLSNSTASPIGAGTLTLNARNASPPQRISQMNVGELSKIINNPLEDKNLIAECLKIRDSISERFFAKINKKLFKAYGWVPKKSDW
ncbi:hypothetical protein [Mucilaginibacter gotjawali]|uniref:Uncharacterized protein n=2 Tax=Mucilaginibacter gotjawali TaxID=1550579 RepID=A0A839SG38_9SPHI|nr:hypothetical protein [Mucilaginibacter gotjawali]MBB3055830.1 hypothetical protein [Mucilaginibacter gotjawali]BAU54651.1 hypothetical protein MgSA37_02829 [Mucilaginibacter gotjawali]